MIDDIDVDNDGYYQDVDEDKYSDDDLMLDLRLLDKPKKTRVEASYKDPKYFDITDRLLVDGVRQGAEVMHGVFVWREEKFMRKELPLLTLIKRIG